MEKEALPEVELYRIGMEEVSYAAPLLTTEAIELIAGGKAFGMALAEEGELRAAACAQILPEHDTHLEIISLYVAPQYRRRRLGSTLLMELLEAVLSATDGTIEFVTAVYDPAMEGLQSLFAKAGFAIEAVDDLMSRTISLKNLADSSLFKKIVSVPAGYSLRTVENTEDLTLRRLAETLREHEIADLSMAQMRQTLASASYLLFNEKGAPVACAFLSKQDETRVYLSQYFTENGDKTGGLIVLQAAADALIEQLQQDVILEIPVITESSAKLAERLLPSGENTQLFRAFLDLTGKMK